MTVELHGRTAAGGSTPRVDNAAARALLRFDRLHNAGDWAGIQDLMADDVECRDHREQPDIATGPALRQSAERFGNTGVALAPPRVLATRGDCLATIHVTDELAPRGPTDMLVNVECDEAGKVGRVDLYDTVDLIDAITAVTNRYEELLDPAEAAALRPAVALMTAIATRSHSDMEPALAPTFGLIDHREGSPRHMDRTQFLDFLHTVLNDDADLVDFTTDIHAINANGLVVSRTQVSLDAVDVIDTDVTYVEVVDGAITVMHFYAQTDLPLALERLALLA